MGFFKKFLSLALVSGAALALAACGGTNDTVPQPTVTAVT